MTVGTIESLASGTAGWSLGLEHLRIGTKGVFVLSFLPATWLSLSSCLLLGASPGSHGWPTTCCAAQAGLELTELRLPLPPERWDFKAVDHHTQLLPPSTNNLRPLLVETLSPGDPRLPPCLSEA